MNPLASLCAWIQRWVWTQKVLAWHAFPRSVRWHLLPAWPLPSDTEDVGIRPILPREPKLRVLTFPPHLTRKVSKTLGSALRQTSS